MGHHGDQWRSRAGSCQPITRPAIFHVSRLVGQLRPLFGCMLLAPAVTAPAFAAQDAAASTPLAIDGAIEKLKPGEFLWAPAIAPDGPVTLIVSLKTQRAYVYRNGVPIGVSTMSSGRPGYETPTGIFTILQKDRDHTSNLYADAPMPYMQRLTWGGIALHAGNLPGYPASHGCIRLPMAFAKLLFGVTKLGLTVVITNDSAVPEVASVPLNLNRSVQDNEPDSFDWHPGNSPSGPVSIVVSGRDKRIVVLRNGIEIGSSTIAIDGPVVDTEAFTLREIVDGEVHWLRLPLPGRELGGTAELSLGDRARLHMPEAFRLSLLGILEPGATLLVTRDSLRSSGTGQSLTVIVSDSD